MKIHLLNLFVVCGLMLLLVLACDDSPHPSDASLEENFYKHEANFNVLAQMAIEDAGMIRIAPGFTWHKESADGKESKAKYGFSDARWNEYKQLFPKLGKNNGILNYQPDLILVLASSRGMVTGGSLKGYAYSPKEPSPLVDSLENLDFRDSKKDINTVYKRLKGNWYLFYQASG
jgi:hypothetical protein